MGGRRRKTRSISGWTRTGRDASAGRRGRVRAHVLPIGRVLRRALRGTTGERERERVETGARVPTTKTARFGGTVPTRLLLVLVHVDRVGARRLGLGVRVDLAGPQAARVAHRVRDVVARLARAALAQPRLRLVEQPLVLLHALRGRAADDRRDRAPLARVELREVEQLLLLLARPLGLADRRVEPLVPARLALLRRLAVEQRRDACPLVLAVLHHRRLQHLVLRVLPDAALDHDAHHGPRALELTSQRSPHTKRGRYVRSPPICRRRSTNLCSLRCEH